MAEWIGIGRRARRCYGFDEIALVPGTVSVNPAEVDTTWSLNGLKFRIPGTVYGNVAWRVTQRAGYLRESPSLTKCNTSVTLLTTGEVRADANNAAEGERAI